MSKTPTQNTPARTTRSTPRLPHLHRDRHGTFYFRLTIDGKTIKRSLGTKDRGLATMKASALNWEWSMSKRSAEPSVSDIIKAFKKDGREFDAEFPDGTKFKGINTDDDMRRAKDLMLARIEAIGPIEPAYAPLRPEHRQQARRRTGKHFLAATKPYLLEEQKYGLNGTKTVDDKTSTFKAFADLIADADVGLIDKDAAKAFKAELMKGDAGAGRVNTKLGHVSDFFEWAIKNGEADENPFDGLRIGKKSELTKDVESYEPFTADELAAIFNPETYPAYATKTKPHFKWLPFLLLYTGARPNELASINLDSVLQEKGIDYFSIRGKTAKNGHSIRKVPFHKVVRESGFMDYLAKRRKDDPTGQLFPLLKPTKNGYAKNVTRRFNESYLVSLRIDNPTHRLYSFRSNFITQLSEENVNTAMIMALVGHYEQAAVDLSSPHFKNYQKGTKLITALREAMDAFNITLPMKF